MRKSCRRPSLVGGKRCCLSQVLPPAGRPQEAGQRRPRPGSAETAVAERELACRLEPRPHLHHHSLHLNFCLPGFCWEAMGHPNSRKPTAEQWVSGISGTSREPLGIPVLSSETERVSVCNGPARLLWDGLGRWVAPSVPSLIPSLTVCDGWAEIEAPDCRGTCLRPRPEGSGETVEPVLVGALC